MDTHSLKYNIGQGVWPGLVSHRGVVYYFPFLVVDFLRLLVAEEQHDRAEQKDGGAPADAVRPAELPHRPVTCKRERIYGSTRAGGVSKNIF